MSIRIRTDGRILCAAMHPEEPGDVYINDSLQYRLSVEYGILVTDDEHNSGHGQWWWFDELPPERNNPNDFNLNFAKEIRQKKCGNVRAIGNQEQSCKVCGRVDHMDFNVPAAIWAAVVPEGFRNLVVCLPCFDAFAHQRNVDYAQHIRLVCFVGERASLTFSVASAVTPKRED